jgi:hypothetical protein
MAPNPAVAEVAAINLDELKSASRALLRGGEGVSSALTRLVKELDLSANEMRNLMCWPAARSDGSRSRAAADPPEAFDAFCCRRLVPALMLLSVPASAESLVIARDAGVALSKLAGLRMQNPTTAWAALVHEELCAALARRRPPPPAPGGGGDGENHYQAHEYPKRLEEAIKMIQNSKWGDDDEAELLPVIGDARTTRGRLIARVIRSWEAVYDLIGGPALLQRVRAGNAMLRPLTLCFNGCAGIDKRRAAEIDLAAAAMEVAWPRVIRAVLERRELAARTPLLLQPIRFALAQLERLRDAGDWRHVPVTTPWLYEAALRLERASIKAWLELVEAAALNPRQQLLPPGRGCVAEGQQGGAADADAIVAKAYLACVEPIARRFLMTKQKEDDDDQDAEEEQQAAAPPSPARAGQPPPVKLLEPRPRQEPALLDDEAPQDPAVAAALAAAAAAGARRDVAVGGFATTAGGAARRRQQQQQEQQHHFPALADVCEERRRLRAQRDRCVDDGDPAPAVRAHDAFGADAPASQAAAAAQGAAQALAMADRQPKRRRVLRIGLTTGVLGIDGGSLPPAPLLDPGEDDADDDDEKEEEQEQEVAAAAPAAGPPPAAASARRDQKPPPEPLAGAGQQLMGAAGGGGGAAPMLLDTQRSCCVMPPPPRKARGDGGGGDGGAADDDGRQAAGDDDGGGADVAPDGAPRRRRPATTDQGAAALALRAAWPASAMAEDPDGVEALEVRGSADPATQLPGPPPPPPPPLPQGAPPGGAFLAPPPRPPAGLVVGALPPGTGGGSRGPAAVVNLTSACMSLGQQSARQGALQGARPPPMQAAAGARGAGGGGGGGAGGLDAVAWSAALGTGGSEAPAAATQTTRPAAAPLLQPPSAAAAGLAGAAQLPEEQALAWVWRAREAMEGGGGVGSGGGTAASDRGAEGGRGSRRRGALLALSQAALALASAAAERLAERSAE